MVLIVFLTFLLFDQHGIINTIYIDYIMAILVGNLLARVIMEKNPFSLFHIFYLSIGCSFLVMTKQIGLTLYCMVLFLYFIDLILRKKIHLKKEMISKCLLILVGMIIIPLLLWKGWGNYVQTLNLEQQFKLSDLKVTELLDIIRGTKGEIYQQEAAKNYLDAIKKRSLTTSSSITLSYLQCIILILLLLYLLWYYKKDYFLKHQIPLVSITLLIGSIGYCLVMLVMYVFSFGPREGPGLASFNRYLPTYILVCLSLIIMMYIYIETNKKEEKKLRNIMIICATLFLIQNSNLTANLYPKIDKENENMYQHHANIIKNQTEENAKVYMLAQGTVGDYQYFVKYYINPRITNLLYYSFPVENIDDYQKYFEKEIQDYMLSYDYLYIVCIDEEFKEKYGFIFNNEKINPEGLYKVINKNGKVKLKLVD